MIYIKTDLKIKEILPIQYVEGANDESWIKTARKNFCWNSIPVGEGVAYHQDYLWWTLYHHRVYLVQFLKFCFYLINDKSNFWNVSSKDYIVHTGQHEVPRDTKFTSTVPGALLLSINYIKCLKNFLLRLKLSWWIRLEQNHLRWM